MSFGDKDIKIIDWTGKVLYLGPYDSDSVDDVLDANRCENCTMDQLGREDTCEECGDTGYKGDFEVLWVDESDKDDCNVYEYINY